MHTSLTRTRKKSVSKGVSYGLWYIDVVSHDKVHIKLLKV